MKSLEYCARQAVRTCAALKKGERVIIIYDKAATKIAAAIDTQMELLSVGHQAYCMETYGPRPDDGASPLQFPDEIKEGLKDADVSFLVRGETKKGEFETFTLPMFESIKQNEGLRHIHMPGITEEAFLRGMSVDYSKVRDFTARIREIVRSAKTIEVTTPAGSDFFANVGKYKWCVADGFPAPGKWVNLPDGEVFTTPESVHGTIVVDGVLGERFDKKYGLLDETPLKIGVSHGRIIRVQCPKNRKLESEFIQYIDTDANSNRFGELAIGTNIGLERLIGNMIHDEKFPGVHIAVGDPIGEETGADWTSKVHCDMVMRKCNILVDGTQIMQEGKFVKSLL